MRNDPFGDLHRVENRRMGRGSMTGEAAVAGAVGVLVIDEYPDTLHRGPARCCVWSVNWYWLPRTGGGGQWLMAGAAPMKRVLSTWVAAKPAISSVLAPIPT